MEQAQFEQAVLRMAHNGGVQRLTPADVGYQLRMSVKDAERMLDKMVTNAQLELDSDDDGNLFYFVPGHGTPGVFTSGTASANPVDPPKPDPAYGQSPGYAPYGQSPSHQSPPPQQGGYPPPAYGQPHPAQPPQPAPNAPYGQFGPPTSPPPPYNNGYGQPQYPPPAQPAYGQPYAAPPGPPPAYGHQPGAPYGQATYGQHNGYAPQGAYGAPPPAPYAYGHNALVPAGHAAPKSPAAASLLSAIIPGAGQLYNGQVGKGLTFFFVTCFLLALPPLAAVPWLWGVVDAYNGSKQQNQRQHYGLLGP